MSIIADLRSIRKKKNSAIIDDAIQTIGALAKELKSYRTMLKDLSKEDKHNIVTYITAEQCVCCGADIPEGCQVCSKCEDNWRENK